MHGVIRRAWQFFVSQSFSSLTRRIVSLNVAGLVALVVGILYLSQFRAGLIDARVESLVVQGEIIAGAIAASATADSYGTYIDRDRLLELQPGDNFGDEGVTGLEFSINPERVAPVLRRLISPTKTRARIYDRNGYLILDSRNLYIPGEVMRLDLPPPNQKQPNWLARRWQRFRSWIGRGDLPRYQELGPDAGKDYPEVAQALDGAKSAYMVRVNDRNEVIVSVAVPVQRFRAVRGALLLSTQGGDINQAVEAERLQIVKLFGIMLVVMVVLSLFLARTIAGPVKRLAEGAERVRHRIRSRVEIPDLTHRKDEIGASVRRASRHDQRAVQPDRGDRAVRRRRRPRAEESADLAALRGRNAAARQIAGEQGSAARRHPARRQAARPADLRHLGCQPPRCRIAAWRGGAGRSEEAAQHRGRGAERDPAGRGARSRSRSRAAGRSPSWCPATIRGSARSSTT